MRRLITLTLATALVLIVLATGALPAYAQQPNNQQDDDEGAQPSPSSPAQSATNRATSELLGTGEGTRMVLSEGDEPLTPGSAGQTTAEDAPIVEVESRTSYAGLQAVDER